MIFNITVAEARVIWSALKASQEMDDDIADMQWQLMRLLGAAIEVAAATEEFIRVQVGD